MKPWTETILDRTVQANHVMQHFERRKKMFKIDDMVIHISSGVCKVEDIRDENLTGDRKKYYILHPVEAKMSSILYIPVDASNKRVRKLLSEEEIRTLIQDSRNEQVEWIENHTLRKTVYQEILFSDNTCRIMAMIVCLYHHREEVLRRGKKFSVADEELLEEAQKKIHQEFSYALSMKEEEIPMYISKQLSMKQ